ncbi:hypothetical protein R1sor_015519 [Riccia sorocarpa]|uniref:DUF676 domain-containing protein n=1 Tax=Riccia sorocarpa TaxID=122646 RepID=A0ABD3HGD0_9MARC
MGRTEGQIPIVLVGHSYGGIVIQELIAHAFTKARRDPRHDPYIKRFLQCLAGIFFYAVPHRSLKQETYDGIFLHGQQTLAEPGQMLTQFNNELIRSSESFKTNIKSIVREPKLRNGEEIRIKSAFEIYETDLGNWKGIIVEQAAVDAGQEAQLVIEADHFGICKPSSGRAGFTENKYFYLREFIVDVVKAERSRNRS